MKSRIIEIPDFDLTATLESGQVFHWNTRSDGSWSGLIDRTPIRIRQQNDAQFEISLPGNSPSLSPGELTSLVSYYFSLDHSLDDIYASFPVDRVLNDALQRCRGLRIIRQPRWECLATFITSPMKRVDHIRQMSLSLRRCFGASVEGSEIPAYPGFRILSQVGEEDLRSCGLGFRARNLLGTARLLADGRFDLNKVASLETEPARQYLCTLPGVGRKVANCVLLFAFGRLDAVPVDVWIGRILKTRYLSRRRKWAPEDMEAFSISHFGKFAGYAQQYLFHYARVHES